MLKGVKGCQVTVNQERYHAFEYWKTIKLLCQYTAIDCSNPQEISWFRYLATSHEKLPQSNNRFNSTRDSNCLYLEIKNVTVQDSGIYVCGITYENQEPTAQNIGQGTTLLVLDENYRTITAGNTSLIVVCTLLFVYCVSVFSYYAYRSKWKICKQKQDKKLSMNPTHKSFKTRRLFQAIAQEYHKRYDRKTRKQNQVIEDDTIYQNTNYAH
ncbi:immunoglobulin superfamily member 6 [Mantella aurantiaca]